MTSTSSDVSTLTVSADSPPPSERICAYPLPQDTPRSSNEVDVRPLDQHIQVAHEHLRRLSWEIRTASPQDSRAVSEQVASLLIALAPVRVQAAKLEPDTLGALVDKIEWCAFAPCTVAMPSLTVLFLTVPTGQLGKTSGALIWAFTYLRTGTTSFLCYLFSCMLSCVCQQLHVGTFPIMMPWTGWQYTCTASTFETFVDLNVIAFHQKVPQGILLGSAVLAVTTWTLLMT